MPLAEGLTVTGKIDRIDVDPFSARGVVVDYKSGKGAPSARRIAEDERLQIPLYMLVARDLVGVEPIGGVYRPLAGDRRARGMVRAGEGLEGYAKQDVLDEDTFWEQVETARGDGGAARRPDPGRRRPARPARRRVPRVVRPLDDVQGEAAVSARVPNPEQAAAIAARGEVFVSAGAGTGKTTVLVERFAEAVCERGLDVESLLVITYTERAAGELRARIRARLVELERSDLARRLDGAWISTIHGFCLRLLKAHPFAAELDPRFRVLDESQGRVLRGEAFEAALAAFCADGRPERLRLLATYGIAGLRRMLTGVYETLRSAGRELDLELADPDDLGQRLSELRDAAECLVGDADATDAQRAVAGSALELDERADALVDLGQLRARGERAATYEEARKAVESAALDELAARDRELLQALLHGFAETYAAAKDRESALDFEDLQLRARDLLRDRPDIRDREALRFLSIMVDEFQDTNRLQCDLVDALAAGPGERELFFVGDEFQSIYGFRHADVGVFRERREAAPQPLALTLNYRSRPEVLAVVNHLFEPDFGSGFQPLAASREFPDPVFSTPVELLVTDKASYADTGTHWRRAEARHIAQRVRELVDAGAAEPGEIVLLFAAGTDAEWYEEELRSAGLPTYRATGKGYFGQQQVVDLLAYLRLLHNRYDDEALLTVLASPFVGVSNDALVLIRRAASKRPIFAGLERQPPPGLAPEDERLVRAFRQRYDRLADAAGRLSLERLCERIVAEHDYDLAVLAQWDGRRRYANLRKLARLARSYEELRGPDVEGFVRFVREQEAVGSTEREAVAEEEGAGAVRLLTIHAAKGLEFKVVVVADAGRDRAPPAPDEILCLADGRFGFRVADPMSGERRGTGDWEAVREARRLEEEAERLRLYYVAMTRAQERLIVSGAVDPAKDADTRTPIGWVSVGWASRMSFAPATGRSRWSARGRACCCASTARTAPSPTARWSRMGSSARSRASWRSSSGSRTSRPRRPRGCTSSSPWPSRRSIACAGSPTAHSPSSSAARTATTQSAWPACGRATARAWPAVPRATPGRRRGCMPPRSAMRPTVCSSSSTSPLRRRPTSGSSAPGIRSSPTRSSGGSPASSMPTAPRRSRAAWPSSPPHVPRRRSRSSTTACCCTAGSTCWTSTDRERSWSTTRRTRSASSIRPTSSRRSTRSSGSCTRSSASGPGPRRSRSCTRSSSGRTSPCRRPSCGAMCRRSRRR